MAFLFKSKKNAPPTGLPQATRNIHTSEGTNAPPAVNGMSEKTGDRTLQSPPPGGSVNNSSNSLTGSTLAGSANGPTANQPRNRSESDVGSRGAVNGQQVPNAALYPWSQQRLNFPTPQSNPFPRYGAAVNSVASKDGDIYMMGGLINSSMVKGDLWMVESGGGNLSCYPIATVSEGPGPRVGHSALLVGNAFIVFGGDTKMDDSDTLDDTLYLLNTSSRQWSRAAPPGPRPAGRYGHTLNILGSKIFIFGGQVEGFFFNDLIAFDLNALQSSSNQWEYLIQNTTEGEVAHSEVPPARTNHSMISYNDQLYLFGGTNGTQWFNDVWTYDPRANAWTQQDCIGYIPAPREGHSAALVNDVMYVFGGRTEEGTDLGDLAAFRITSRRWYTFQNMGPSPSPRSGHSMTAYGRQIVILAGEPSSAPRDPSELSMVYVLDTAKIRYPNDAPAPPQGGRGEQATSPVRRTSNEVRSGSAGPRSVSREGQMPHAMHLTRNGSAAARDMLPAAGMMMNRPSENPAPNGGPASRLLRSSVAQAPAGPPPQGQAPTPRTNGVVSPQNNPQSNTQSNFRNRGPHAPGDTRALGAETVRAVPAESEVRPSHNRELSKENTRPSREVSPVIQGRRTPTQQTVSKAKAMETNEAAPMITSGTGPSRQRSLRSQRGQGSIDSSEEGLLGRAGSGKHYSDGTTDARSSRSMGDEPRSPRLTPHQEALVKELEAAKSRNAWYASELALARKAGYHSMSSTSPTFDERAVNQFADDDRPLIEAFMTMRAELVKIQQTVDQQAAAAGKKIGEIEHQRDAAISEAAYARAKLAAHGGSQNGTPQPGATRDLDEHSDRQTDISRRLALALAAQSEHKAKLDSLASELASERKAREMAEESADSAQRRLEDLSQGRNPMEIEGLRADLHIAQGAARSEAGQRAQAEDQLRMLQVDKEDLARRHEETSNRLNDHVSSMAALEAAVAASTNKASVHQRQLEDERQQRETLERKLTQLKAEHEERTTELDNTSRRLRDAEELAESNAQEAATHRVALMSGFARIASPTEPTSRDLISDQRLAALQQSADQAHALARSHQDAADTAAQKLRSAEERIAGLEAYQEQSSREGLQIRRQLQAALRDVQTHQSENRGLKGQLEQHQRDANALSIQHGALKDLLGERGINMADARRSPMLDNSPNSRFGTSDQNRLRELEQQLQNSLRANDETRQAFETREQEADRAYREKLEQLDTDYQSAVQYVKGTERVLKKMKDELAKSKTQNLELKNELESAKSGVRGMSPEASNWTAERDELMQTIDNLKADSSNHMSQLQMNLSSVQRELAATQAERDQHKSNHADLSRSTEQSEKELAALRLENSSLHSRALDAEDRITMLLGQVEQSVGNYRRQSQMAAQQHGGVNGLTHNPGHNREQSTSTMTDTSTEDEHFTEERGSMALDNFASELETLRNRWESSTSRSNRLSGNYRLSSNFDFERTPTKEATGGELDDSLANWRKKLAEEEKGPGSATSMTKQSAIKEEPTT